MNFGHQTLTQVIISNLVFTNIYAGTTRITKVNEANNQTYLQTKIIIFLTQN